MALHNIKIVVVDGGRVGTYKSNNTGFEANNAQNAANNRGSPLYKLLNAKQLIKNKVQSGMTPAGVMTLNMSEQISKQLIRQTANYYISDIGRKNGDSNYQAIVNRQIEVASDWLGAINNSISGAATGSMFGPIGTAIGVVAGFASSIISIGFRQAERERNFQHEMFKENTSQAYNLARANYSAYTGRVR